MLESLFPARRNWPEAISDVSSIPVGASGVRLVSKSTHFKNITNCKSLKSLWCFDIDESRTSSALALHSNTFTLIT